MKIVIDIDEDVYTRLFDNGIQDNEIAVDDVCEMARALRLGTPLPKGHGRLIDADVALNYFTTNMNYTDEEGYNVESDVERRKIFKDYFDGVTTVLEAEGSDGREVNN